MSKASHFQDGHVLFPKPRVFWYHFNKPETLRQHRPIMTVHINGECLQCQHLSVQAPCQMVVRKIQPVVVMHGHTMGYTQTGDGPMSFITIHPYNS